MSRFARTLAALFVALLPALACAGSITLDPLTTPFYQSACQAEAGRWVLFPVRFCMGTCPPDTFVTDPDCRMGIVSTPDLRLPVPPDRDVWRAFQLAANVGPDDDSSVEMLPAEGAFDVHDHSPGQWWFLATWQSTAWNLDLAAIGAIALRLPLTGEIDEARPLFVTALLESYDGTYRQERLEARASTTGDVVLPFSGAAPSHVIGVVLVLTDCPADNDLFCDSSPGFGPRRSRIGAELRHPRDGDGQAPLVGRARDACELKERRLRLRRHSHERPSRRMPERAYANFPCPRARGIVSIRTHRASQCKRCAHSFVLAVARRAQQAALHPRETSS